MKIIQVKIEDLKPAEYNPRKLTEKQKNEIKKSIDKFGMVEPIVVNSAPKRKNIIIGGHQRFYICREIGWKEMPVVYVNIPDIKKEQELNLRLNKNLGDWDYSILSSFDEDILLDVGFEDDELKMLFSLDGVEELDIDPERFNVIMVNPPEAPKLRERVAIHFENIDDYKKVKEAIKNGDIDSQRLIDLL